jgi:hypothetical protein
MQIHNAIRFLKEACALKNLTPHTKKSYTHLSRRQRLLLKLNQHKLESLADQARGEPDHDSRHRCPGVQRLSHENTVAGQGCSRDGFFGINMLLPPQTG